MSLAHHEHASGDSLHARVRRSSRARAIGTLLALASIALPASCSAFAVYVFQPGPDPLVPGAFSGGNALVWDQENVDIMVSFAPDPPGPLSNGTLTWNENALDAMSEWNDVGANIRLRGQVGAGDPCIFDGNVVAAFDPTLCLGVLPAVPLGVTTIRALITDPTTLRFIEADVAVIPPGDFTAGGATIQDAYDGPIAFPFMDFRRIVLHELGHVTGLAHPDEVFGISPFTEMTVMYSFSEEETLAADDKNGVLALYGAASNDAGNKDDGDGGGSAGGWLAILLGMLAASKFARNRCRARCPRP